jgi:hypothetical protein
MNIEAFVILEVGHPFFACSLIIKKDVLFRVNVVFMPNLDSESKLFFPYRGYFESLQINNIVKIFLVVLVRQKKNAVL